MSEKKPTIEERYAKSKKVLKSAWWDGQYIKDVIYVDNLLDDLMAEREKMKEPGMNTIHLSDGEMSIIYDALREYELLYSLAMRPEVEEALKTASTKMATVVFAKED